MYNVFVAMLHINHIKVGSKLIKIYFFAKKGNKKNPIRLFSLGIEFIINIYNLIMGLTYL